MSYFLYYNNIQEYYEFEDPVTIGREEDNNIILDSEQISSVHFTIISRGSKWYIQDQDSKAGTLLNKRKLPPMFMVALEEEDVIECDEQVFIYTEESKLDERKVKEVFKRYENVFPGGYDKTIVKNASGHNDELLAAEARAEDLTKLISEEEKQISELEQELAQATAAYRQKILEIEKEFSNKLAPLQQSNQANKQEKEEKLKLAKESLKRVNSMIKQAEGKEYALELDFDSTNTKRKINR